MSCAVVVVKAIISEHHHLHEEGLPVRQRWPMQLNTLDLPDEFVFKAEKHFETQNSRGRLALQRLAYHKSNIFF